MKKFFFIQVDDVEPYILKDDHVKFTYFDFIPEKFDFDFENPDFIMCNSQVINFGCGNIEFQNKVNDIVKKFPSVPILIDYCTGPNIGGNLLEQWFPEKPVFLENRHWALLHYTNIYTYPKWANPDNFLYFDLRFEHYRFYTMGGCPTYAPFEHKNVLWRRPFIENFGIKQKKFLAPNRVKPKNHESGGRYYLNLACQEIANDVFQGNQPHVINSGSPYNESEMNIWYDQQNSNSRLVGCLEDPTIDNFNHWNPITGEIKTHFGVNQKLKTTLHDVNNMPHVYYYEQSYCSVYSETNESGDPLPTEKTWHALGRGHFILPFGGPGLIDVLKNMGFQFPDFIDYSYDQIRNDIQRRDAWLEEFKRLANIPLEIWQEHFSQNLDILKWNAKNFYVYPAQNPYKKFFKDVKKYENQVQ